MLTATAMGHFEQEFATGVALGSLLAVLGLTRILVWPVIWKTYGEHCLVIASRLGPRQRVSALRRHLSRRDRSDYLLPIYFTVASVIMRGTLL